MSMPEPPITSTPPPPPPPKKKPFWKRPLGIILIAIVVIIVIAAISSGGGSSDPESDSPSATQSKSDQPTETKSSKPKSSKPAKPEGTLPLQDGDWRLDQVNLEDGLGDFSGTARITYTGDDNDGGGNVFTITVLKGDKVVASLDGSADDVKPGGTETVTLISTDKWKPGPYNTFDFQTDF